MTKNRVFIVMVLVGLMALLAACQFGIPTEYTVSGKITDANGVGIAGVKLSFTNLASTCETANDGSWSMTGLKGSFVVMPMKEGYTFTPETKHVSAAATNVNFTAVPVTVTPPTYNIAGKVTDPSGGTAVEGVTLTFDTCEETSQTAADGSWSMVGLSGTVVVTPAKEGYVFTPESRTVTGEEANVDFIADLPDEMKVKNVLQKYVEHVETKNLEALVALYDDSYFGEDADFASREEFLAYLKQEFGSYWIDITSFEFVECTIDSGNAVLGIMLDTVVDVGSSCWWFLLILNREG